MLKIFKDPLVATWLIILTLFVALIIAALTVGSTTTQANVLAPPTPLPAKSAATPYLNTIAYSASQSYTSLTLEGLNSWARQTLPTAQAAVTARQKERPEPTDPYLQKLQLLTTQLTTVSNSGNSKDALASRAAALATLQSAQSLLVVPNQPSPPTAR